MEFDKVTKDGEKYALLRPTIAQNEQLKKEAQAVGTSVTWNKADGGYRLFEDKIPDGVDVDKTFGKWVEPEQVAAAEAERNANEKAVKAVDKAAGITYEESTLFYPLKKDRPAIKALANEQGLNIQYIPKAEAWVSRGGELKNAEHWQTPEAKAAFVEEGKEIKAAQEARSKATAQGMDVMKERANGNHFLADNAQGFMLPSTKEVEVRKAQLDALAGASKDEVAAVYKITDAEKKKLDNKQYAMQISAAQKKDPSLATEDFNKMSKAERMEAAGIGLRDQDFKRLVGLQNGFFAVRDRAIELGLVTDRKAAKQLQADAAKKVEEGSDKSMGKSANTGKQAAEQEAAKGSSMAQAMMAAGAATMGR